MASVVLNLSPTFKVTQVHLISGVGLSMSWYFFHVNNALLIVPE